MAEGAPANGRALRVYQVVFVLAIGWLVGRLPQILADEEAETARLMAVIQPSVDAATGPASAAAGTGNPGYAQVDTARLAADVAAQVAAQVANETVSRLIAAGWGPRMPPQQIVIQAPPGAFRPMETTVRIVTEPQQLARIDYDLPAGSRTMPDAMAPYVGADAKGGSPVVTGALVQAHAVATQGYAALKAGDKRSGARLLGEAISMAPDSPEAVGWTADVQRLTKRWSIAAYTLARSGGLGDPLAA